MPQFANVPEIGLLQFPDDATPDEIQREVNKADLARQMALVREDEPKVWGASAKGAAGSLIEGINRGAGKIVRGLGFLSETASPEDDMPMPTGVNPGYDQAMQDYQEKMADPLKLKKAIETNPITKAGAFMEDTARQYAPKESEADSVLNQTIGGAAELAPVMNPAGPIVIGLQALGKDLNEDFQKAKEEGKSEEDAARAAIDKAGAAGLSQAVVFAALPKPLRAIFDKYVLQYGEAAAQKFLLGRISAVGEGAILGGTAKAAENAATGEPITKDVGKSAAGMATLQAGMPYGGHSGERPEVTPGDLLNEKVRQSRATTPEEPKAAVTRDLAAELKAAMEKNQVVPGQSNEAEASGESDQNLNGIQSDSDQNPNTPEPGAVEKSASDLEVLPEVPNSITVRTPAGNRRVTVSARVEGDKAVLSAIKLHDDETGAYDRFNVPRTKSFLTLDDAALAGFDLVRAKFPEVRPLQETAEPAAKEVSAEDPDRAMAADETKAPESETIEPKTETERLASPLDDDHRSDQSTRANGEPDETLAPAAEENKPAAELTEGEDPELLEARRKLKELQDKGKGDGKRAGQLRDKIERLQKRDPERPFNATARKTFDNETEQGGPDILSWIADTMPLLSKSKAQRLWSKEKFKANQSLWDDAPLVQRPHHNLIYGGAGASAPDQVASAAHREGLLEDGHVDTLWAAIDKASRARRGIYENARKEKRAIKDQIEQDKNFKRERASGKVRVDTEDLAEGQTFTLRGQKIRVESVNEDTGEVKVNGGGRYGTQTIAPGESVYADAVDPDLGERLAIRDEGSGVMHERPPAYRAGEVKETPSAEPGDPSLWNISDRDLLNRIVDAQDDESPRGRKELDLLENEARERGLIDKTRSDWEAEQKQQEKKPPYAQNDVSEPEREEERQKAEREEVQRRQQYGNDSGRDDTDQGKQSGTDKPPAGEPGPVRKASAETATDRKTSSRLDWLTAEAQRERDIYAQSAQSLGMPGNRLATGTWARIHYIEGQIDLLKRGKGNAPDLQQLEMERVREVGIMERVAKDRENVPQTAVVKNALARVRYLDGMIDEILRAREEKKAAEAPGQKDLFEEWLDQMIDKTDPLKEAGKGELQGGLALPKWATKTLLNNALRVIRAAYQTGLKLKEAIEEGVTWLRDQNIKGFDRDEAREWLTQEAQNAEPMIQRTPATAGDRDWKEIGKDLDEAHGAVREVLKLNDPEKRKAEGITTAELAQRKALATARVRELQDELRTSPNFIEHLLTRNDQISNELKNPDLDETRRTELADEAEQVQGILAKMDGKQVNAIYSRLQETGVIAKPPKGPPIGRSLDELHDWLKQAGIDSPKRTLRERLDLARRIADKWQALKDGVTATRAKIAAAWAAGIDSIKNPPRDSDFRNVIKDWIFGDQYTGLQNRRLVADINKAVENPLRQMAISVWLDVGGDEARLRYQASAVPERFAKIWRTALELTPKEKELALRLKADWERKLEDGMNAGIIKKGRADYGVPQIWEKAPEPPPEVLAGDRTGSPGNWQSKLDPRDPFFAFQRAHPTYFDGIMAGGIPKDLKIGNLVGVYNEAFHKTLSSRGMIWALKDAKADDGMPVVKLSGSAQKVTTGDPGAYLVDSKTRPEGDTSKDGRPYRSLDHFALRDWKVANVASDGKKIVVRGDMLVHPDHYEFLKNELLNSPLREGVAGKVLNPLLNSGAFLKASKMAFAGFHMMTIGEHMASHLVNPFTNGFEIDLREPDQALLVRNGLELGMSGPQVAFEEGLASHGGLFHQVPGLGDLAAKMTDWMFKQYIPTITMKAALKVLENNRGRYGEKLTDSQIAELTAHQMNAASGLQNYRLLGRNKVLMDFYRLALLAPQFLESRAKVVAQALKPYGAEQRKMLILQAALMYVGCRVLNQLLDKDAHWELKAAFGVVYHGRMYSIRTIVGDLFHALTDPASFASGRLSPLVRMAIETATQRDMRTGARKEPPIQTASPSFRVAQNLVVDLAKWLMPIGSEGLQPGAAGREQTAASTALAAFGVGSRKYTNAAQVHDWAADFNRHGDAAAKTWQRHADAEPQGEGAYRKLDALLDAGKIDQARNEYAALQGDGHKAAAIAERYQQVGRAFTGNQSREQAFRAALTAAQKQIYNRAIAERQQRLSAFRQMMGAQAATN